MNRNILWGAAALALALPGRAQVTDIQNYGVEKTLVYNQTSPTALSLDPVQPYQFGAFVFQGTTNMLLPTSNTSAPFGSTGSIAYQEGTGQLYFQESFNGQSPLDTTFLPGTYNFDIQTSAPQTYPAQIKLNTGSYPTTPQVTAVTNASWNSAGALVITNPALATKFTWPTFTTTSGGISFYIFTRNGAPLFHTYLASGMTSYTLAGGTLSANTAYETSIQFQDYSTGGSSNLSGVFAQAGYVTANQFVTENGTIASSGPTQYSVEKSHIFIQTSNNPPTGGVGDVFDPAPDALRLRSPVAGSVIGPSGTYSLILEAGDDLYEYSSGSLTSQSTLDSTYPDGSYKMVDGNSVSLTGDVYPNASSPPIVTLVNGAAPQWNDQGQLILKANIDNVLTWTAYSGSNSNYTFATGGHETVVFSSYVNDGVYLKQQAGLGGSATAFNTFTIPASTLTNEHTYVGQIAYTLASSVGNPSTNTYDVAGYTTKTYLTILANNSGSATDISVVDTPTVPLWALVLLGGLFVFAGGRLLKKEPAA